MRKVIKLKIQFKILKIIIPLILNQAILCRYKIIILLNKNKQMIKIIDHPWL